MIDPFHPLVVSTLMALISILVIAAIAAITPTRKWDERDDDEY